MSCMASFMDILAAAEALFKLSDAVSASPATSCTREVTKCNSDPDLPSLKVSNFDRVSNYEIK